MVNRFCISLLILFCLNPFEAYGQNLDEIGVVVHLVGDDLGNGALSKTDAIAAIDYANVEFASVGVKFIIVKFELINDDDFVSIAGNNLPDLLLLGNNLNEYVTLLSPETDKAINVFFIPTINGSGLAPLPAIRGDSINYNYIGSGVVIENSSATGLTSTIPHEFGHYFGLFHTYEGGGGEEYPRSLYESSGGPPSNASSAGDFMVSTEAEPRLEEENNWSSDCLQYVGDEVYTFGGNNYLYEPDVNVNKTNFMSGAPPNCRTQFTQEQKNYMIYQITTGERSNLINQKWVKFTNEINTSNAGGEININEGFGPETIQSGDYVLAEDQTISATPETERFGNTEKHRDWNGSLNFFKMTRSNLLVSTSTVNQVANFEQLYPTVITTYLISENLNDAGTISFLDPWYVSNLTTFEQPNQFLDETDLPFTPPGIVGGSSGGVFRNIDPVNEPVSYSIKAEDQSINGFNYFLEEWKSTGGVNFMDAAASTTSLNFTGTNTTVTANMKAYFAASTKQATSSSNGYKLTSDPVSDDLHLVYIDNGRLYYTTSTDGGTSWSKDERLDASSNYTCLNPSIGVDKNGNIHIVWEREGTTSIYDVEYISKTGSTWSAIEDLGVGIFGGEEPTTPTVHVEYDGDVFVAWKRTYTFFSTQMGHIEFKFKTAAASSWTISDDVPGTGLNSRTPTIIHGSFGSAANDTYVFWRDDSEEVIQYITGDYVLSTWTWDSNPTQLPSSSILSEHALPSAQAKVGGSSNHLYLTWQATEKNFGETKQGSSPAMSSSCPPASTDYPAVCFQEFNGSWSGLTIFRTSSPCDRKPVVTSWATSSGRQVMLAFEKSPDNVTTVLRDELGSWGAQTTVSSDGSNPGLTNVDDAEPNLIYTTAAGAPHPLVFDYDLLPPPTKEDTELPHSRLMSLNIRESLDGGRDSGLNGSLAIEMGDLQLSTIEGIKLIEPQFRGNEFNQNTAFTFKAIPVSEQTGTLKIPVTIKGLHLSESGQRNSRPIIKMNVLDAATNSVLQTVKTYQTDIIGNQNRFEQRDTIEVNLGSITAPVIYINGKTFLQKNSKNVTIADVYDLRETESSVAMQDGKPTDDLKPDAAKGDSKTLPTDYVLAQNYPNPFNPTTQIEFSLPKTSYVELKVFDTNGRLIKTLVSNTMEAGQHQQLWDGIGENGLKVGSGVYFYRLTAGSFVDTKKMTLIQ